MPLEVVGAGFGRTGTMSLKHALEILGLPCHHMIEVIKGGKEHTELWIDAYKKDGKNVDWSEIFVGYKAAVDFPVCPFFLEVLEYYPNAKCVLTYRDTESWWQSAHATILTGPKQSFAMWMMSKLSPAMSSWRRMLDLMMFKTFPLGTQNEPHVKSVYEEHNERVKRLVAADRLLIFQVKEGWAPLCNFLGKPIPDTPFPRVNDRDEFVRRIRKMNLFMYTVVGAAIGGIAMLFPQIRAAAWSAKRRIMASM